MVRRDCVVVMARYPVGGTVKTRLAASIGDVAACGLYASFLRDTVAACRRVEADLAISYAPDAADAHAHFARLAPEATLVPQTEAPFGERLSAGMSYAFARGHRRVAIIGSDIPHIRPVWIRGALAALDASDVAIGPTDDGSYYLLATRSLHPCLFQSIDWSSGRELAQTLERARDRGLVAKCLERTFDIDTADDLDRLRLLIDAGGGTLCRATAATLGEIGLLPPARVTA